MFTVGGDESGEERGILLRRCSIRVAHVLGGILGGGQRRRKVGIGRGI